MGKKSNNGCPAEIKKTSKKTDVKSIKKKTYKFSSEWRKNLDF